MSFQNSVTDSLRHFRKSGDIFQSIFMHLPNEKFSSTDSILHPEREFFGATFDVLTNNGVLWICVNNSPTHDGLDVSSLELATKIQSMGFYVRNIILWYNSEYESCSTFLKNRYTYILFATKDPRDYKFDIDRVREPHIWKDYEWGGGRRSRYHPLGKNPSNFWIRTISKQGKTIMHVPLTWDEVVSRCLQVCTQSRDKVLGIIPENRDFAEVCNKLCLDYRQLGLPSERSYFSTKTAAAKRSCDRICLEKEKQPTQVPRIYFKSSENMGEIGEGEIQSVITSPPYWGLRDYGVKEQIGFNESYAEYLQRLETVWAECSRVLGDTGTLWININKRTIDGKILLLFPVDIVKSCKKVGFTLQDIVVWFRAISVPSTGDNNFTDRYEFILMLSKSDIPKFYQQRMIERDFFNEKKDYLVNVWKLYRLIGNLSEEFSAKTKFAIKHTAMFPDELVRRIVTLSSDEGDTILDPFLGSGTTISVATRMGRNAVGYEINEAFRPLIQKKMVDANQSLSRFL